MNVFYRIASRNLVVQKYDPREIMKGRDSLHPSTIFKFDVEWINCQKKNLLQENLILSSVYFIFVIIGMTWSNFVYLREYKFWILVMSEQDASSVMWKSHLFFNHFLNDHDPELKPYITYGDNFKKIPFYEELLFQQEFNFLFYYIMWCGR